MLKNILKLDGAQKLTNNEQKSINGGMTRACSNAIAAGCVVNVSAAACFAAEGVYNSACKCCNY
ncbi:hypothetical protein [Flavobacterium sp.]|uniref:hypothetical protein n=1 Tax=Flavobacterium sp. TaxID=239 RepID=UPI0037512AC6